MIADRIIVPDDQHRFFAEKIVSLPTCYLINNYAQDHAVGAMPPANPPEPGPFVFCCFNTAYKIDPSLFGIWMKILEKTPNSELWLMPESARVQMNLKRFASKKGIDPRRLIFKKKLPKPDHLKRLASADLALDTLSINGIASSADALWAGLPVLTLQGRHFGARVSSSLLNAIGLPELIVTDLGAYEKTAVELGNSPKQLQRIRERLWENRKNSPLFDTHLQASHLEKALKRMWRQFESGQAPAAFTVGEVLG
jgi:predicted O-linked N-acetylglucosamine transferase (SPINDLY family)